ncbi:GTP-binding protein [Rhodobacteraceae bacterium 63075]|nr:GTP-binding protein [Rhodobacteraceae bacterium 63075]
MTRLPLTVIAGYLGAGKTTLINRLLAEDHGLRLMVLVNDFGAINIDAELLESADEDKLTLSNGCVCCTIGGDLFMAVGDALDREPRPDHLIIEASGVAQPAKIAAVALAEKELAYAGVVTLVDALNYGALSEDRLVQEQVKAQVSEADLVLVTKGAAGALQMPLAALSGAPVMTLEEDMPLAPLLLEGGEKQTPQPRGAGHPAYASWSAEDARSYTRDALAAKLAARPEGVYRVKGRVRGEGGGLELHVVGSQSSVTPCAAPETGRIVAIGPKAAVSAEAMEAWWS